MLIKLFGTSVRVKILKYAILHQDMEHKPKELSKTLKIQLNSAKRELENLEKFGLFLSSRIEDDGNGKKVLEPEKKKTSGGKNVKRTTKTGNQKIQKKYFLNKDFVLFEEIKALIIRSQILYEKNFVDKVSKIGNLKLLVFTGLFVDDETSEIDLFIVGKFKKDELIKVINELEKELGREVNYTLMSEREFKYRRDITDVFLYGILEGKKIVSVNVFDE